MTKEGKMLKLKDVSKVFKAKDKVEKDKNDKIRELFPKQENEGETPLFLEDSVIVVGNGRVIDIKKKNIVVIDRKSQEIIRVDNDLMIIRKKKNNVI